MSKLLYLARLTTDITITAQGSDSKGSRKEGAYENWLQYSVRPRMSSVL
jgi:hypothetical protein